jgi:hypothetical protein
MLDEVCGVIYEKDGQQGVLDFINRYFMKDVDWVFCRYCEVDSPMQFDSCLVCGSFFGAEDSDAYL